MRDLLRDDHYVALRKILRDARNEQKLNQKEVSRRISRPQSYISAVETGVRRLDITEFLKLANALGLDPVEVVARINESNDAP